MRRTMIAVAIGLALSQAAHAQKTRVYFGEDPGPGNNTRLKQYPRAKGAYEKFKSALHELDSFSFESLENNSDYPLKLVTGRAVHLEQKWWEYELEGKDIRLDFGDNETAVLKNMSALNRLPDQNISAYGGFPVSGSMYVSLIGKGPEATVESTIEFSEPQSAFGFYVTDIEKNKLQIELIRDGQEDEVVKFPLAATDSDEDKYDEDIQIVDEDNIVFLFHNGTAPIVFDRIQNE